MDMTRTTSDYVHIYLVLNGSKEHVEIRDKFWNALDKLINRSPYDRIISSMERPGPEHPDGRRDDVTEPLAEKKLSEVAQEIHERKESILEYIAEEDKRLKEAFPDGAMRTTYILAGLVDRLARCEVALSQEQEKHG